MINLLDIYISPDSTIETAMEAITLGGVKIALVVSNENKLLGTVSDGDIRRKLLQGKSLRDSVKGVYRSNPIVASKSADRKELAALCSKNKIEQIPIVNDNNIVINLFILEDIFERKQLKNMVVLMVGGLGTRLKPLTEGTPKPMLKVGGKPILQTIVEGFVRSGFVNITMCSGYKSSAIQDFFKDGSAFGANINYVIEEDRMGTAGALSLIQDKPKQPFFVMNGDLLTNIDYEKMLDFHLAQNSMATMCIREYDIEVPYGVISIKGEDISSIEEKPVHNFFVNAGIYLLDPSCIDMIPNNEFYDMPSLFENLISNKEKVIAFPLKEYWLDIGRLEDFKKANIDYQGIF